MSVDDSWMYSGLTSASARAQKIEKEKKIDERIADRQKLEPAALRINEFIEQEKRNVVDLKSLIVDDEYASHDDIKAELLARRMTYQFIVGFQTHVNNLLREPKQKREKRND